MFLRKRKKNQIIVKDFSTKNKEEKIRLFSIGGITRDKIIEQFNRNYLIEGNHIKDGGKASSTSILTLIGTGSGALGLSGVASGNLFKATANPASLMTIGNGVGSAVMGAGGIIGQAPFIPMAGAIMPVIAPLLAFQAVSSVLILNQFKAVNEQLVSIQKNIECLIVRHEATFLGEILSASNRLKELDHEFSVTNHFSKEMIIRLSLIESKVNPLLERYRYLYERVDVNKQLTAKDANFKQSDAYLALILSILDLQLGAMRLKLSIQENPGYMKHSAKSLAAKVESYSLLWKDIENNPKKIKEISNELRSIVENMSWWSTNVPSWLLGKKGKKDKIEKKVKDLDEVNSVDKAQELTKTISNASNLGESLKQLTEPKPMSLLYWIDEKGEHSYYTDDLILNIEK